MWKLTSVGLGALARMLRVTSFHFRNPREILNIRLISSKLPAPILAQRMSCLMELNCQKAAPEWGGFLPQVSPRSRSSRTARGGSQTSFLLAIFILLLFSAALLHILLPFVVGGSQVQNSVCSWIASTQWSCFRFSACEMVWEGRYFALLNQKT